MGVQKQKKADKHDWSDPIEDQERRKRAARERARILDEEMDELLKEIDEVLEDNAQEIVDNFIQYEGE